MESPKKVKTPVKSLKRALEESKKINIENERKKAKTGGDGRAKGTTKQQKVANKKEEIKQVQVPKNIQPNRRFSNVNNDKNKYHFIFDMVSKSKGNSVYSDFEEFSQEISQITPKRTKPPQKKIVDEKICFVASKQSSLDCNTSDEIEVEMINDLNLAPVQAEPLAMIHSDDGLEKLPAMTADTALVTCEEDSLPVAPVQAEPLAMIHSDDDLEKLPVMTADTALVTCGEDSLPVAPVQAEPLAMIHSDDDLEKLPVMTADTALVTCGEDSLPVAPVQAEPLAMIHSDDDLEKLPVMTADTALVTCGEDSLPVAPVQAEPLAMFHSDDGLEKLPFMTAETALVTCGEDSLPVAPVQAEPLAMIHSDDGFEKLPVMTAETALVTCGEDSLPVAPVQAEPLAMIHSDDDLEKLPVMTADTALVTCGEDSLPVPPVQAEPLAMIHSDDGFEKLPVMTANTALVTCGEDSLPVAPVQAEPLAMIHSDDGLEKLPFMTADTALVTCGEDSLPVALVQAEPLAMIHSDDGLEKLPAMTADTTLVTCEEDSDSHSIILPSRRRKFRGPQLPRNVTINNIREMFDNDSCGDSYILSSKSMSSYWDRSVVNVKLHIISEESVQRSVHSNPKSGECRDGLIQEHGSSSKKEVVVPTKNVTHSSIGSKLGERAEGSSHSKSRVNPHSNSGTEQSVKSIPNERNISRCGTSSVIPQSESEKRYAQLSCCIRTSMDLWSTQMSNMEQLLDRFKREINTFKKDLYKDCCEKHKKNE